MHVREAVINEYEIHVDSVSSGRKFSASPQQVARSIGVGRLVVGGTFLVAPKLSVRILGVDSGTAKRMTFLARMAAARDIGLGVGTLNAGPGAAAVPWLLVGAAADAVDAAVIAGAMRHGTTRGVAAAGIVVGAAVTAAVGVWAARGLRR
jgi:hypothetical protein